MGRLNKLIKEAFGYGAPVKRMEGFVSKVVDFKVGNKIGGKQWKVLIKKMASIASNLDFDLDFQEGDDENTPVIDLEAEEEMPEEILYSFMAKNKTIKVQGDVLYSIIMDFCQEEAPERRDVLKELLYAFLRAYAPLWEQGWQVRDGIMVPSIFRTQEFLWEKQSLLITLVQYLFFWFSQDARPSENQRRQHQRLKELLEVLARDGMLALDPTMGESLVQSLMATLYEHSERCRGIWVAITSLLVDHGLDINMHIESDHQPMVVHISEYHHPRLLLQQIEMLLEVGADITSRDIYGYDCMFYLAHKKDNVPEITSFIHRHRLASIARKKWIKACHRHKMAQTLAYIATNPDFGADCITSLTLDFANEPKEAIKGLMASRPVTIHPTFHANDRVMHLLEKLRQMALD